MDSEVTFCQMLFLRSGTNFHTQPSRSFFFFFEPAWTKIFFFFFFKILTLVAREFLKQVNRIGNKWNYLTPLADGFPSPGG